MVTYIFKEYSCATHRGIFHKELNRKKNHIPSESHCLRCVCVLFYMNHAQRFSEMWDYGGPLPKTVHPLFSERCNLRPLPTQRQRGLETI